MQSRLYNEKKITNCGGLYTKILTSILLSFFITPFFSRLVRYADRINVESIFFLIFILAIFININSVNIIAAYRNTVFKPFILTPALLLISFLIVSSITSHPPYRFFPYFIGFLLIYSAAFYIGYYERCLVQWLKVLSFLISFVTITQLGVVVNEDSLRWTELSLFIGFGIIIAAIFCNLRTLTGLSLCLIAVGGAVLTIISGSVGGITILGLLLINIIFIRLNKFRVSWTVKAVIGSLFIITIILFSTFITINGGNTIATVITNKLEKNLVSFDSIDEHGTDVRVKIYALQWFIFMDNWKYGIGLGKFQEMNELGHGNLAVVNHNNLLKCLSEGGIIVGISYILLIISYFVIIFKVLTRSSVNGSIYSLELVALACGLVFLVLRGFAMDTLFLRQFFVILGLFAGRCSFEVRKLQNLTKNESGAYV